MYIYNSRTVHTSKPKLGLLYLILLCLANLCLASSCQQSLGKGESRDTLRHDSADFAHALHFKYARGIRVNNHPQYKEVILCQPTSGDTLATYIIYPRAGMAPQNIHSKTISLAVPIQRIACLSTPQLGTLPLLGAVDQLVGAAQLDYINNPEIRQRVAEGSVIEIARGMNQSREALLLAHPEVLLQDYPPAREENKELLQLGITPILFNSWQEQSLLGRAEWIKLAGLLLGCNLRADSVFTQIAKDYEAARQLVPEGETPLPILYGLDYKGVWYIPGEHSYATSMLRDAGLSYSFAPGVEGSMPTSFEHIFNQHRHAKLWISSVANAQNIKSKADFLALGERYASFDAGKAGGRIFLDAKRLSLSGGNDYWESAPYRPDLILKDLIKMSRPHLLPDYELQYFVELR